MKKNKLSTFLCLLLSVLVVIGGCAKGQEAKQEQVLKVAIGTDINTWDIVKFPDGDARFVWSQMYETLVRLDSDLNLVPGLAESWESQEDGKVWIFHLRKNVKFHDGTPFTAAAVQYSYGDRAYVTNVKTLQLESVEALDDYTVKFTCVWPLPLPTYLTHIAWPIVSPSSVDSAGVFQQPVGTGPFKLVSYSKGQEVVMEKNPDYWGGEVKLDQVIFKIIPDASTRIMALSTGDVDMSLRVPETDVASLEKNPEINVYKKLTTFTDFLQFNCAREPFNDINIRKAVANAIDTEAIVKNILNNVGIAANGRPFSPVMMYISNDLDLYSQDQEKARTLLKASGWNDQDGNGILEKNGKQLQIDMLVGQSWSPREMKIAQACQAQLGEIGFVVNVKQLETAALSSLENEGNFDIIMRTGYFVWGPYPHHVKIHFSKNFASHYQNAQYDQLVLEGERVNSEEQKKQIYEELQKIIVDDLPAFYIVHEEKVVAARKSVQGYEITAEEPWLELKGISISE
ncbi:MAG: ABC transporter substrate-binding protein [Eubacteriales bacterium]